jgi:hypothetical protein
LCLPLFAAACGFDDVIGGANATAFLGYSPEILLNMRRKVEGMVRQLISQYLGQNRRDFDEVELRRDLGTMTG